MVFVKSAYVCGVYTWKKKMAIQRLIRILVASWVRWK